MAAKKYTLGVDVAYASSSGNIIYSGTTSTITGTDWSNICMCMHNPFDNQVIVCISCKQKKERAAKKAEVDEETISKLSNLVRLKKEKERKMEECATQTDACETNMPAKSTRDKLRDLVKPSDQKLLEKHRVIDPRGNLTFEGEKLVMERIFETVKAEIVADLQKLEDSEKSSKKK